MNTSFLKDRIYRKRKNIVEKVGLNMGGGRWVLRPEYRIRIDKDYPFEYQEDLDFAMELLTLHELPTELQQSPNDDEPGPSVNHIEQLLSSRSITESEPEASTLQATVPWSRTKTPMQPVGVSSLAMFPDNILTRWSVASSPSVPGQRSTSTLSLDLERARRVIADLEVRETNGHLREMELEEGAMEAERRALEAENKLQAERKGKSTRCVS